MENPILIKSPVFEDNRGVFAPLSLVFNEKTENFLQKTWIQSNISINPNMLTIRGLHYQKDPYSQTKLVKVITGMILDFIVDIRPTSDTLGKVFLFEVEPNNMLYVPKGFAHGFITLKSNTIVQYLVDNDYSPSSEASIHWESVPEIREYLNKNNYYFTDAFINISVKDNDCQTLQEYLNT